MPAFSVRRAIKLLIGVILTSVKRGRPDAGYSGGCHGIDSTYGVDRAASTPPLGRQLRRRSQASPTA